MAAGAAFAAGLISITSPCTLPLLPGYLGYLTGLEADEMRAEPRAGLRAALLFVAGFAAVFVALGATASELGSLLAANRTLLFRLAGVFILLMGSVLLLEGRLPLLARGGQWARGWGRGQTWAALPLGAAFAITWTPCVGPVLGAVLTLAASTASLGKGVLLLAVYSLGLALPFLALSLSIDRVRPRLRAAGRLSALLQPVSGAILVAMGLLLVTDRWLPLVAPVLAWYAQLRWPPL